MNFLKYLLIGILVLVFVSTAGCVFMSGGIKSKPGYAKLATPSIFSTDTTLALNFGPGSIKSAQWIIERLVGFTDKESEVPIQALLTVLKDIQGLQLRIYEVENNQSTFDRAIDDSVATLTRENWETIIKVNETDERVVIMQSVKEELITGLAVLVSTSEEAIFINLIGPLNPESIVAFAENISQI